MAGRRFAARSFRPLPSLPLAVAAAMLLTAAPARAHQDGDGAMPVLVAQADTRDYDIPAGPLEDALLRFGRASGRLVASEASLTKGLTTRGLRGRYSVAAGLRQLLAGSGLEAVQLPDGGWRLRRLRDAAGVATLASVQVVGRPDPAREVYETPASVAVVTREQIERLPPRNSADLLAEVSGVYTSSGRDDPGLAVNIRGMQDFGRVNVMIDGTRQNYQQSGHGANGHVYLDPALVSSVSVAKGPVSTVGGAGMIAGMVNFRTLDVEDILRPGRSIGGRVQLSTGSNAYHFSGNTAVGARFGDEIDLVAAVSRKNVGAFKIGGRGHEDALTGASEVSLATRQEHWSGLLKIGWHPAPGHDFKLSYIGMDAKFASEPTDRTLYGELTNEYNVVTQTLKLDYAWTPNASPWWELESSLYYTNTRRRNVRDYSDNSQAGYSLRYQTETVGSTVANASRFALGPVDATWRNGGEFWYDWTSPQFNDAGSSSSEGIWYSGPTPQGDRTVISGFSEMTLDYQDWLQLIAGLRYDWYSLSGDGQVFVGSIRNPPGVRPPITTLYTNFDVKRHEGAFAPKLTLSVKPLPGAQLYASYGEGLRPPSLTETLMHGMHSGNSFAFYASPNLREERSRNWEFGLNLLLDDVLLARDSLRLKTAWFDTRVKNYMMVANVMGPAATVSCGGLFCHQAYVNLKNPVRLKGLELQLEYDARNFFLGVNYTRVLADWGRMRYDLFPMGSWVGYPDTNMGTGDGQQSLSEFLMGGPPQRKLSLTGGVRLFDQKVELGVRFRNEKPSTLGFASNYGQTRTWDAWLTYRPTDALTMRLSVENLRDEKYIEVAGGAGGWSWAPGRTVIGTLSYEF